jgi:prepilin-type processing-associated H-X9-DG protein
LTPLSVYLCPSDFGPSVIPVYADPPDPANPGTYSGTNIVDTLARGNYVGVWGIGEVCAQSGGGDVQDNNGLGPFGRHAGIFYRNSPTSVAAITDGTSNTVMVGERSGNLSYVTWVARSIDGWLGMTPLSQGGGNTFFPSPEEAWCQVLGPMGVEDGLRTPNDPEAHIEDYWSRHPGGVNFLFADGSVHFIKSSIHPNPYRALATRAYGEIVSSDSY